MFQKKCVEKITAQISWSITFHFENRVVFWIMWREYFKAGQVTRDNIAHEHSTLDTEVYKHTVYRVSQEECAILRESVPYVELYRYNPKHLYAKLNGYGDNGQRSLKL